MSLCEKGAISESDLFAGDLQQLDFLSVYLSLCLLSPVYIEKKSGNHSAISDWNGAKHLRKAYEVFTF